MHELEITGPTLPPAFEAVYHDGPMPVFERAVALAPTSGAGALVWGFPPGLLTLAVVLEPDRTLAEARPVFLIGMGALAGALAGCGPPERLTEIVWPDTLIFNRARVGSASLIYPQSCSESDEPEWLVFAVELSCEGKADPGLDPDATSLAEEGFEEPLQVVESFARHLMLGFDTWEAAGLDHAVAPYLRRLERQGTRRRIEPSGDMVEIGEAGALLRHRLQDGRAVRAWTDPLRGPKP